MNNTEKLHENQKNYVIDILDKDETPEQLLEEIERNKSKVLNNIP